MSAFYWRVGLRTWAVAFCAMVGVAYAAEEAVKPLPSHPGNIFVQGEEVVVPVPESAAGALALTDYEGRAVEIAGQALGDRVSLGRLAVGYYELHRGEAKTTIGVVSPLAVPTPKSSPIGIDIAMAWFYDQKQMPAVANLCVLAGMNWVRDRLSWPELEPAKGKFAVANRYDTSAKVQSAAGLRVLQVAHISPGWTKAEPKRFPPDLRDAYAFWKEMAKRWKGQVEAFEPWNEADIDVFGGHTGAEMAALQKASYLGLKAGNPEVIASLNVFAINRKATLDDLDANEAWPYFDTCDLHHYIPLDQYPAWYGAFRGICAGRPMWVTEFSMPMQWSGDEKLQELSEENLRVQAERVPMVYAAALSEGVEAAFYFMFPHYVEGKTQFGIVRRDLTPRPAYLAAAAAGRLLADAKPMGRVRPSDARVRAYVFHAKPDGKEREVLVGWMKEGERALEQAVVPEGVYDHLGRPVADANGRVRLSTRPVYLVLPVGTAKEFRLDAAPQMPVMKVGRACSIVLQSVLPEARTELGRSAYRISSAKAETIPVFVYNFGEAEAKGKLSVSGPKGWKVGLPETVEIRPGDRQEVGLVVDCVKVPSGLVETVRMTGDFGEAGRAVLSLRLQPDPPSPPGESPAAIKGADDVKRWQGEVSGGSKLNLSAAEGGGVAIEATLDPGDRWVYPRIDLGADERATGNVKELRFKLTAVEGEGRYRVIFVEENGASYVGELMNQPKAGKTIEGVVLLDEAVFGSNWSPPDGNARLDADQVKAIKIGCNATSGKINYRISDVRWVKR